MFQKRKKAVLLFNLPFFLIKILINFPILHDYLFITVTETCDGSLHCTSASALNISTYLLMFRNAQKGCRISILGDFQKQPGCGPGQAAPCSS